MAKSDEEIIGMMRGLREMLGGIIDHYDDGTIADLAGALDRTE